MDREHVLEMDGRMFKTVNLENVQLGENGEDGHNVIKHVTQANRIVLHLHIFQTVTKKGLDKYQKGVKRGEIKMKKG